LGGGVTQSSDAGIELQSVDVDYSLPVASDIQMNTPGVFSTSVSVDEVKNLNIGSDQKWYLMFNLYKVENDNLSFVYSAYLTGKDYELNGNGARYTFTEDCKDYISENGSGEYKVWVEFIICGSESVQDVKKRGDSKEFIYSYKKPAEINVTNLAVDDKGKLTFEISNTTDVEKYEITYSYNGKTTTHWIWPKAHEVDDFTKVNEGYYIVDKLSDLADGSTDIAVTVVASSADIEKVSSSSASKTGNVTLTADKIQQILSYYSNLNTIGNITVVEAAGLPDATDSSLYEGGYNPFIEGSAAWYGIQSKDYTDTSLHDSGIGAAFEVNFINESGEICATDTVYGSSDDSLGSSVDAREDVRTISLHSCLNKLDSGTYKIQARLVKYMTMENGQTLSNLFYSPWLTLEESYTVGDFLKAPSSISVDKS
jgi:hypothetical protein